MPTKELTFDTVEREIRNRSFGVLSTASLDGRPHSTGVLYGVSSPANPFYLYVTTNRENKKARNIARNPKVSFTIPLNRRLLRFLPPHCVQFSGTAQIISFDDQDAGNAFNQSLVLRQVLKLESKHIGPKAVFIRICPDHTIHTYGLGLSFFELLRNIRDATSRVEIPTSRLETQQESLLTQA